jgi:hypothetical protein
MRHLMYSWWSSMGARAWLCFGMCWDGRLGGVGEQKVGEWIWSSVVEREGRRSRRALHPHQQPLRGPLSRPKPQNAPPPPSSLERNEVPLDHTHTYALALPWARETTPPKPLEKRATDCARPSPSPPSPSRQNRALRRPRRARLPAPTGVLQRSGVPATGRAEREAARAARAPAFCRHQEVQAREREDALSPLLLLLSSSPAAATPSKTWCRRAAPPR